MGTCNQKKNPNSKRKQSLDVNENENKILNNLSKFTKIENPNKYTTTTTIYKKDINEMKLFFDFKYLIDEIKGEVETRYDIIKIIGEGGFGKVYYAKNKFSNTEVSIKTINKSKNENLIFDNLSIKNEIDVLKSLSHPNIMKIYEFYSNEESYFLVNEYIKYGELSKRIKQTFSELQISVIIFQILKGLSYIHSHNIIHRDIKLENIMINDIENILINGKIEQFYWIKIIDFGIAKFTSSNKKEKGMTGTLYYMAPEVIKQNYNYKCDIWSVGIILYILLTGKYPFDSLVKSRIKTKIEDGEFDEENIKYKNSSKELKDLLKHLLNTSPTFRYNAKDALKHDFFKKNDGEFLFKRNLNNKTISNYLHTFLNYSLKTKFYQITFAFLCHNMKPSEKMKELIKIFHLLDINHNGLLNKDNLYKGIKKYLPNEKIDKKLIDKAFSQVDNDNDNFIGYEDILKSCLEKNDLIKENVIKFIFNMLDKDNKGEITFKYYSETIENRTANKSPFADEIKKNICEKYNIDEENGILNYDLFRRIMSGDD